MAVEEIHTSYNINALNLKCLFLVVSLITVWDARVAEGLGYSVDSPIEDQTVYVGDNVTLVCDLNNIGENTIYFYHLESQYYISYGNLLHDLQGERENRYSVSCDMIKESCSLTIFNVSPEDSGMYECGLLISNNFRYVTEGYLTVVIQPPSEKSPYCFLVNRTVLTPQSVERIHLKCVVNGTSTPPFLVWNIGSSWLTGGFVKSYAIETSVILNENDRGVTFTCLMSHPALQNQRNCSLTPLPFLTTTLPTTTNEHTTEAPESKPETVANSRSTNSHSTKRISARTVLRLPSYIIPIAASVFGVLMLFIIVFIVFTCCRRRKVTDSLAEKPNIACEDITKDAQMTLKDENLTTYSEINSPNSNGQFEEMKEIKTGTKTQNPPTFTDTSKTAGDTSNNINDVSALYAKPQKGKKKGADPFYSETTEAESEQYANLPHFDQNLKPDNNESGLMYADLDLSGNVDISRTPTNNDVTFYADIRGAS